MHIVGLVGSLRKKSYNRALMNAFVNQAPEGVTITVSEIHELPFYNEDIAEPYPLAAQKLKDELAVADGFIIATPEYNRGTTAVLKNAIDWMSRPQGSPFKGKPVFVVGASNGNIGTAVAQTSLKNTFLHLDARVIGRPEFYMGMAQTKFDEEGTLIDEDTKGYIDNALLVLVETISKNS